METLEEALNSDQNIKRRRICHIVIIISSIIVLGAIIAIIIIFTKGNTDKNIEYNGTRINCVYEKSSENEENLIINKNIFKNNDYYVIINEEKHKNIYKYKFPNKGKHNITIVFKEKLTSLFELFNEVYTLIEVDLSQVDSNKITILYLIYNYIIRLIICFL